MLMHASLDRKVECCRSVGRLQAEQQVVTLVILQHIKHEHHSRLYLETFNGSKEKVSPTGWTEPSMEGAGRATLTLRRLRPVGRSTGVRHMGGTAADRPSPSSIIAARNSTLYKVLELLCGSQTRFENQLIKSRLCDPTARQVIFFWV